VEKSGGGGVMIKQENSNTCHIRSLFYFFCAAPEITKGKKIENSYLALMRKQWDL
jgi:hypothetical protein